MRFKLLLVLLIFSTNIALANDMTVQNAIKKYKSGDYTSCMQDLKNYVKKDPSNALAHYYLALSYTKLQEDSNAINSYNKVIALKPNEVLINYAQKGKALLNPEVPCAVSEQEFIEIPLNTRQKQKKETLPDANTKAIKDTSNNTTTAASATVNKKPTDEEIVEALRVLNNAGLNNIAQPQTTPFGSMMPQNNQLNELNMLFGNNNSNNNNNNAFLNMIPYLLTQQDKNGENKSGLTPEAVQAIMLNSMMPNFDFNLNNKDK